MKKLIIISNLMDHETFWIRFKTSERNCSGMGLQNRTYPVKDELFKEKVLSLTVKNEIGLLE